MSTPSSSVPASCPFNLSWSPSAWKPTTCRPATPPSRMARAVSGRLVKSRRRLLLPPPPPPPPSQQQQQQPALPRPGGRGTRDERATPAASARPDVIAACPSAAAAPGWTRNASTTRLPSGEGGIRARTRTRTRTESVTVGARSQGEASGWISPRFPAARIVFDPLMGGNLGSRGCY